MSDGILVLLVSLALMFTTAAEPAAAQGPEAAPVKACAAHGTSFTADSGDGGPVTLRMGCAQDAGALRPLAKSDGDLVMAFEFHVPERRQQARDLARTLVEETRADQRAGMSLAESFAKRARRDSVGVYPPQGGGPDFDGQVHAVDDSIVLIAPAGDIGTAANWWQKWIAAGVSLGITIASSAVCLLAFNVGAPAAAPVCGAVGGALGALVGELMNAYFDDRSLGDAEVWKEALAVAMWGAVGGAFAGQLMNWAAAGTTSLITKVQVSLRHFATKLKAFGDVLTFMAGSMAGMGPKLLEALERLRGISGTATPLRVMVVGDSMSQGDEGDWTWRYRLWQWFKSQHVEVDFVGPYKGTRNRPDPVGPAVPPLQGEPPTHPSVENPPVSGRYAAGVDEDFDSDHFAVWGRQAAQDKKLIGSMVTQYRPDLLLVGLGFNDMGWFVSGAQGTLDSVKTLVDNARAAKPDLRFAVANVPQRSAIGGREDLPVTTAAYNDMLARAIPSWSTQTSRVESVDWAGSYDCAAKACPAAYDGLHPNALGEFQIARAFEQTLHRRFGIGRFVPDAPRTVPARPTPAVSGLVAEAVPSGIRVTWQPVFGAHGYTVRSRIAGNAVWSELPVAANRFDTTWTMDGWKWEYQVRTDNGDDGTSAWSPTVSAVADPETAAPPEKIVTRATARGVDVSWDAPKGPHTDTIDRYEIILWDKDTPGAFFQSTAVKGRSAHVDDLKPGHRYLVAVATWNRAGGGMPGVARSVTVGAGTPPKPTDLKATAVDPTTVQLDWKGSKEAAGYRVWVRNVTEGGAFTSDEYVTEDTGRGIAFLFPGYWNFEFCVTAINGAAESPRSDCVSLPNPPSGTGVGGGEPPSGTGVGSGEPPSGTGVGGGEPPSGTGVGSGEPPSGTGVGSGEPPSGTGVGVSPSTASILEKGAAELAAALRDAQRARSTAGDLAAVPAG
ncbi:fibronectin type III domain-containing protein [Streptomyces sp. NPDC101166]|uniref:fibronectin type III domain-containing protein n=1 Tax=Streptomyces sp. NPDC101166 TaxID=3366120 RepID=UPI00382D1674